MKKFFNGLKSLITKPSRKKFIGFLIPGTVIIALIINREYMTVNYPIIFILLFWGAIPVYICFLGTIYQDKKNDTSQIDIYRPYNDQKNMSEQVSHIEKKTTVTNTTVTTETVYFKEGSNYIE